MKRAIFIIALIFATGSMTQVYSQSFLRKVVKKTQEKVERKIEKKVYDAVEEAVRDTVGSIMATVDSAAAATDSVMSAYEADMQASGDVQPVPDVRKQQVMAQFADRAPSQDLPFFLSKSDVVITYAGKNPRGKVDSYTRTTIVSVDYTDERNFSVESHTEIFDDKMEPLLSDPMTSKVLVENGMVSFDPGSMAGQLTEGMEISGDFFFVPDNIVVGDELLDYEITISIGGLKTTTASKGIKVVGQETLEISGHSIDCYIIESTVVAKAFGIKSEMLQKIWYGRGIGEVRTEIYTTKGKQQSVSEIVEIIGL